MSQLAMAPVLPVFSRIRATFHMHSWILTAAGDTVLSLVGVGQGCLVPAALPGVQLEGALAPKRTWGPVLSAGLGKQHPAGSASQG